MDTVYYFTTPTASGVFQTTVWKARQSCTQERREAGKRVQETITAGGMVTSFKVDDPKLIQAHAKFLSTGRI